MRVRAPWIQAKLFAVMTSLLVVFSFATPYAARALTNTYFVGSATSAGGGSCTNPDYSTQGSSAEQAINMALEIVSNNDDVIVICDGTYRYTGNPGHFNMPFDFTIRAEHAGKVTLDGQGSFTLLFVNGGHLTVDGLRFINAGDYGALAHPSGALTVISSEFVGNVQSSNGFGGGAIYGDEWCYSQFVIIDSTFLRNAGPTGAVSTCSVSVSGSTFIGNTTSGWGGALYVCDLELTNSMFTGNTAMNGGAVSACEVSRMESTKFTSNAASLDGGAMSVLYASSRDILRGNTFSRNRASGSGGAVMVCATDVRTIRTILTSNRFKANRGRYGDVASKGRWCGSPN
jgi:hypothetical protein